MPVIQCSDAMLAAFKSAAYGPDSENETMRDSLKNGIEAALLVWHQDSLPREPAAVGYLPGGKPIYPCRKDMIYTAAIVSCHSCRTVIRGAGGPMRGALCPTCWEAK